MSFNNSREQDAKKQLKFLHLMERAQTNNEVEADIDFENAEVTQDEQQIQVYEQKYVDEVQKTNTVVDAVNEADEAYYQAKKKETNYISDTSDLSDELPIQSSVLNKDDDKGSYGRNDSRNDYYDNNKHGGVYDNNERGDVCDNNERGAGYDNNERGDAYDNDERGDVCGNNKRGADYDNNERGDVYNEDNKRMKTQCHTIFIQNLPHNITKHELEIIFNQSGLIKNDKKTGIQKILIHKDKITGESNGEATIIYEDEETAQAAINLYNGKEIFSNIVTIKLVNRNASGFSDRDGFHDRNEDDDDDYRGEDRSGDSTGDYHG